MAIPFTKILIGEKEFNLVLPEKSGGEKVYNIALDGDYNTISGNIDNLTDPGIYKVNFTYDVEGVATVKEGAILQICLLESSYEDFLPSALAQIIFINVLGDYTQLIRIFEEYRGYPTLWDLLEIPQGSNGDSVSVNFTNPTAEFGQPVTLGEINVNGNTSQVTFKMPSDPTEGFEERFTEIETSLDNKQDKLTEGDNITIKDNKISASVPKYEAGDGIEINNNTISVKKESVWGIIR